MDIADHIKSLDREGQLLAAAAERARTDAAVPTCPDWQVRDLLLHTGTVHRWATGFVADGHTTRRPLGAEPDLDGEELLTWFREGHAALVSALQEAPADLECWTFMRAPSPLAFWARRQAHETAIHRMDAEAAAGVQLSALEPEFAADGIDELLRLFHARPRSQVRSDVPKTLRVRASDTGAVWTSRLTSEPSQTVLGEEGAADCELTGPAEQLYAALWNRLPLSTATMTGDSALTELWREKSGI
ncbi:maleylpyruvate isomerase family mycothiol-dependent enzyme [Streptomyces beijiangensis]|uniref:Maleylpyruvate isomerase family mycothiol-dependent enzyme n=1 Tax=Streptomyces beijiangensis TaxID=163361 RepID=A0A939FDB5_9ACTN|nr:maleylpyruvate isomerase family mycothiol-dependent enzyme [Streptomyces beijiangensis]MBO0516985.1 maleylpyruvate isomerase family mycothiol-dependent enzyme [Streptomyces beijiangensis]